MTWGKQWDQTEDVVVTFGDGERVKFVVGVCSEMAMGQYRAFLRQAQRWIDEQYSFEFQSRTIKAGMLKDADLPKLDDEQREIYDLADITFDQLNKWAAIRAALRGVYIDTSAPVAASEVTEGAEATEQPAHVAEWQEVGLPDYWLKPASFMQAVPTGLVSSLYMQVNALNPGVFTMWAVGTQKKIVKISIGSSVSLPQPSSTRKKK